MSSAVWKRNVNRLQVVLANRAEKGPQSGLRPGRAANCRTGSHCPSIGKTPFNSIDALLAQQLARFGENHRPVQETRQTRTQFQSDLDARKIEFAEIQRKSQWQLSRTNGRSYPAAGFHYPAAADRSQFSTNRWTMTVPNTQNYEIERERKQNSTGKNKRSY